MPTMLTIEQVKDAISQVGDVSISSGALQIIFDACKLEVDRIAPQPDSGDTLPYQAILDDALVQLVLLRVAYMPYRSIRDGSYAVVRENYESEKDRILSEIQSYTGIPIT